MKKYDLIIKNAQLVLEEKVIMADIAVSAGKIAKIEPNIDIDSALKIFDATGKTVFPGGVDCHTHLGIYRPIDEDSLSETKSALTGGVTSMLTYFRTGQHYMNTAGSYKEILPLVINGIGKNAFTDFGVHLSPMTDEHVGEMEWLVSQGVTTFKYFMFYKGLNLSASSDNAKELTMSSSYDLGHLYRIMEKCAELNKSHGSLSVSVHCEDDEIIKTFIKQVKSQGLTGLEAYCKSRPPISERVAILKAGTVANATGAVLNIMHVGSSDALNATVDLQKIYPNLKMRREVTLHALGLTYGALKDKGYGGKVNPPLRDDSEREALWAGLLHGDFDWVGSDHACTPQKMKDTEFWDAACGFGGTALMYPFMISEGHHKRGMGLCDIARLVSTNPSKNHAIYGKKGAIAVGFDADITVVDMSLEKTVHADMLNSAQEYTPFDGAVLRGWPVNVFLRGNMVFENGKILGAPTGEYLKR